MADNLPRFAMLKVAGRELEVLEFDGTEGVSQLFSYEIRAEIKLPVPSASELRGEVASLTLHDGRGFERTITGIVADIGVRIYDNERAIGTFVIRPSAFALTLGRDCYAKQDASVVDVLEDRLASHKGPLRYELTGSYPTSPYRVQYREDNWTYVSRLMEEAGIYYWFDHASSSSLVLADESRAAPDLPGGPVIEFIHETGALHGDKELIHELTTVCGAAPTKFSMGSFDHERPAFPVAATVGDGPVEVYDAPGGASPDPVVIAARVKTQMEGSEAARKGVAGHASSVRMAPGFVFELTGHPLARLDGRYLVTSVHVSIKAEDKDFSCVFTAIEQDTPYRPPEDTPLAKQAGLQMGQVTGPDGQEVHPDELGRIRTQLHWDRTGGWDESSGTWMRVAQRGSPGSQLLPRMGWNVATFNNEGTVDAPSIIRRIHDGEHLPTYGLPANKTRVVFKTATTPGGGSFNEIYFEDKKGSEEMFINASKDMAVYTLNDKREYVHHDSTRTIGVDRELNVFSGYQETVNKDQTVTIGGNETIEVGVDKGKGVQGSETVTIGGSRTVKVATTAGMQVAGNRTVSVGPAIIDLSLGSISAMGAFSSIMVGGALIRLSAKSISEDVGKIAIQTIGGAKVEIAKKDRPMSVDETYRQTVGGAVIQKTNSRYMDNADTTADWRVGALLSGEAPEVWAEAITQIRIKCGSSVLTLTTDSISIVATELDLSGAVIDAMTETIEHN